MAEITPTNTADNSGDAPEEKSLSSAGVNLSPLQELLNVGKWFRQNPGATLALMGIAATFVYFYAVLYPFFNGLRSAISWAIDAWKGDQSYGAMVPWIALGLFIYHRDALKASPKSASNVGLFPLIIGILLFVASIRCVQPRFALASISFLLYGGIYFVCGRATARIVLFPCVLLMFMIPVGALEQATSNLQFIITGLVGMLSHLCGIAILAVGTTLTATDGSFNFEIAEGCSGIRSITAMTMLTAVYVHLTQDRLWKKGLIFGCSLIFSIVGNTGRIFTIVLVAKYYDPKVASGLYHDYSGYLFFPIALLAMLLFSQFVNLDFRKLVAKAGKTEKEPVAYE